MRIFDNGFKAGDGIDTPGFANGLMKMAKALESLSVHNGRVVWSSDGRPTIVLIGGGSGGGGLLGNLQTSISGSVVSCTAGNIVLHGIKEHPFAGEETVTLSGSVEWVYLEVARSAADGTAATLKHSSTKPTSNSDTLRLRLAKYENSGSGYAKTEWPHIGGDFNFDAPML